MSKHTIDIVDFGGTEIQCHKEERAGVITHGYDIEYCPYCGESVEHSITENQ